MEAMCLAAVRKDDTALRFVRNQTDEVCKVAITESPVSLQYVVNQTMSLCLQAVKANRFNLQYMRNQSTREAVHKELVLLEYEGGKFYD